jgi:hypothetical protein
MKVLIDCHSDRISGFTMLGPEAGEVIAVVQTAMLAGLPYTELRDAILTHQTMAEGLNVLFANAWVRHGNRGIAKCDRSNLLTPMWARKLPHIGDCPQITSLSKSSC